MTAYLPRAEKLRTTRSAAAFDCPRTHVGSTALSVEMRTNTSAPQSSDADAVLRVPSSFVIHACVALHSQTATCFIAAQWKTASGIYQRNISKIYCLSRTSA